jgi:hypothetical protein
LIISSPPSPSSNDSSCGEMAANHVSGDMSLGGAEIKREAALSASREMLGPRDSTVWDCAVAAFCDVLG